MIFWVYLLWICFCGFHVFFFLFFLFHLVGALFFFEVLCELYGVFGLRPIYIPLGTWVDACWRPVGGDFIEYQCPFG